MSSDEDRNVERIHMEVFGRVQGVAFRAHTQRQARELEIDGWVRNRSDGSVEIVAEGPSESLRRLEQWCNTGPATASVAEVKSQWLDYIGDLGPFAIRYV